MPWTPQFTAVALVGFGGVRVGLPGRRCHSVPSLFRAERKPGLAHLARQSALRYLDAAAPRPLFGQLQVAFRPPTAIHISALHAELAQHRSLP